MYYENDVENFYPMLDKYIASKVPGSTSQVLNYDPFDRSPIFSEEEYELFKNLEKYNL